MIKWYESSKLIILFFTISVILVILTYYCSCVNAISTALFVVFTLIPCLVVQFLLMLISFIFRKMKLIIIIQIVISGIILLGFLYYTVFSSVTLVHSR